MKLTTLMFAISATVLLFDACSTPCPPATLCPSPALAPTEYIIPSVNLATPTTNAESKATVKAIQQYWGGDIKLSTLAANEKAHPIPLWRINDALAASTLTPKKAAIIVIEKGNKDYEVVVKPYNGTVAKVDGVAASAFIGEKNTILRPLANQLVFLTDATDNLLIARVYKDGAALGLFLQATEGILIKNSGAGPTGGGSGLKLPPPTN